MLFEVDFKKCLLIYFDVQIWENFVLEPYFHCNFLKLNFDSLLDIHVVMF